MNAASIRGDWVGQTIDRRYPLLAWLGGSGTSGVFLTEIGTPADATAGRSPQKAAIKLIPASAQAEDRLAMWASTVSLSHPHLLKILYFGRAEINGVALVYVVTELAEEVLSEILPQRPLTPDETEEMLGPVLDALTYVHAQGLVHGHVKPSNILVVENEVKLSSDGLLSAGKAAPDLLENDIHHAPETATGPIAPSADLWSLGVTLVEALTQQPPLWDAAADAEPQVTATIPKPFDAIVPECLRINPERRGTISDVRAMLEGKPRQAAPETLHLPQHPHPIAERATRPKIPLVPLIVGFLLLVAIIIALHMRSSRTYTAPQQTAKTADAAAEPEAQTPSPASAAPASPGITSQGAVVNRAEPEVPRAASATIHGTVNVEVRVTVSPEGTVTNTELVSRGPSAYFARLAVDSARNWTFRPPRQNGVPVASAWLLRYRFRSDGTDTTPKQTAP